MQKIQLTGTQRESELLLEELASAAKRVLASSSFILGPELSSLESEVSDYLGTTSAVGVASGTDAITIALRSLEIGPGDEVIVPAYSFYATVECVLLVGATPVFVDVDPVTYCIDPELVSRAVTEKTKAVIAVHLYGQPARMSDLAAALPNDVSIVEDNAQAIGASVGGLKTGSIGTVGCLSFYPTKNLSACGDAGMIVSSDDSVIEKARVLRTHGWRRKYEPEVVGYNSRLDEIQAAILRAKLPRLDMWTKRRREIAEHYGDALGGLDLKLPQEDDGTSHVFHLYVVRTPKRDSLMRDLSEAGIGCAVYYPVPLHLTEPLKGLGHSTGDFPHSELACKETLAIPLHPHMTDAEVSRVTETITASMRKT